MFRTKDFLRLVQSYKSIKDACDMCIEYLDFGGDGLYANITKLSSFIEYDIHHGTRDSGSIRISDTINDVSLILRYFKSNVSSNYRYAHTKGMEFIYAGDSKVIYLNEGRTKDTDFYFNSDITEEQYFQYSLITTMPFEHNELSDIEQLASTFGSNDRYGIVDTSKFEKLIMLNRLDEICDAMQKIANSILRNEI